MDVVLRRQMAVYFVGYVTALPKAGQEVPETTTQSALRRMWVVNVRNSLYLEADKELAVLFQAQLLVFRLSLCGDTPPIQIFSAKLSVEMQRVSLYYEKRMFYWRFLWVKKLMI